LENQNNGFGVGLLVGLAVGVGIGLLFAPDEGKKTRKLIKDKVENVLDTGADQLKEVRKQTDELIGKSRKKVGELVQEAKKQFAE
jgi:gas vesicle protein